MPTAVQAEVAVSREQLRTFHITGAGLEEFMPVAPLQPAALDRLPGIRPLASEYPMYAGAGAAPVPLADLLGKFENGAAIAAAFGAAMGGRDVVPIAECSGDELLQLKGALPEDGVLVAFGPNALPLLHAAALASQRKQARQRFLSDITRLGDGLRELLRLDAAHSPNPSSPDGVAATLGIEAGRFINSRVLAAALDVPVKPLVPMTPDRRRRIERTLATLDEALQELPRQPAFRIFHSGEPPAGIELLGGECRHRTDSFQAALEACDQQLDVLAPLLRAVRIARLECEGAFDPAVHDAALARFDWQAANPEELAAIPAMVVLETAEGLANASLTSFGRLLRSGRPVQVLIAAPGLYTGDFAGFVPDFGYLSIAHREAFVLQASLARTGSLLRGFEEMTRSLRPAVAVVSVPAVDGERAWMEASVLHLSRAFPLYRYDPDRGESWSQRFALVNDPPVEHELTAAHAAALSRDFLRHFRIVPASALDGEPMELANYLDNYAQHPPLAIPFISIVDAQGNPGRAIVSRDLVNLARDRRRAWRVFEELAGVNNAYVQAAVAETRKELQEMDAAREQAAKLEGAKSAIHGVVAMLTGSATSSI